MDFLDELFITAQIEIARPPLKMKRKTATELVLLVRKRITFHKGRLFWLTLFRAMYRSEINELVERGIDLNDVDYSWLTESHETQSTH